MMNDVKVYAVTVYRGVKTGGMNPAAKLVRDAKGGNLAAYTDLLAQLRAYLENNLPATRAAVLVPCRDGGSGTNISTRLCVDLYRLGFGAGVAPVHTLKGRPALVVDDVTRRGATIRAAARRALEAGAATVTAVVYAAP